MTKKILIIFNPVAGFKYQKSYKKKFLEKFEKCLPQTGYDWLETTPDLQKQLANVNFENYGRIIAIGGDGTVKNIADYLLANNIDVPLAIVPQGSANVLASSLNIPMINNAAIKTACLGRERKMDVCLMNNKEYILIGLTIGHWSTIVKETSRGLKIRLGALAYLMAFFKQLKIYSTNFKFSLDGQAYDIEGNTMIVANALSIFKLQPRTPVDWFDGQLEVLICKNKTILGFFLLFLSFFLGKRRFPYLFKAKGRKIVIEYKSQKEKRIQIDGETVELDAAKQPKIIIESMPAKLTIITNG